MSLGGRLGKPGRAAVSAFVASTPREPLLFLYPTWFRHSSTSSAEATRSQPRNAAISPRKDLPDTKRNFIQRSDEGRPRTHSKRPTATLASNNSANLVSSHAISQLPKDTPKQSGSRIRRIVARKEFTDTVADRRFETVSAYRKKKQQDPTDWRQVLENISRMQPKDEPWLARAVELLVPRSAASTLIHGIDNNIWDLSIRFECSVHWDKGYIEEQRDLKLALSGTKSAIYRIVTEILRIAPSSILRKNVDSHSQSQKASLHGTIALSEVSPDAALPWKGGHDGRVRTVVSDRAIKGQIVRPEDVPVPNDLTKFTYDEYITHIISLAKPIAVHNGLYEKNEHRRVCIVEVLKGVFLDEKFRDFLSRSAFNKAIAYCVRHNLMVSLRVFFARMEEVGIAANVETFNQMLLGAGKHQDLHNFEFILRMMLNKNIAPNGKTWVCFMMAVPDLAIRLHILQAMKERGFLRTIRNMNMVTEHFASREIERCLDEGMGQDVLVQHMDNYFGPYWLTTKTGNQVLHALGSRGLISRSQDFLLVMRSRDVLADNTSVCTILSHCRTQRNIHAAIRLMQTLPAVFGEVGYVPNQVAYKHLFEMAWRGRCYNLCKVIWKYACLHTETEYTMRTRVFESLRNACYGPHEGQSSRDPWYRSAGYFILGLDHHATHPMLRYEPIGGEVEKLEIDASIQSFIKIAHLNFYASDAFASKPKSPALSGGLDTTQVSHTYKEAAPVASASGSHVQRRGKSHYLSGTNLWPTGWNKPENAAKYAHFQQWAKALTQVWDLDMSIWKRWKPVDTFGDVLTEAWKLDQAWIEYGHKGTALGTNELLEKAMGVRIKGPGRREVLWL